MDTQDGDGCKCDQKNLVREYLEQRRQTVGQYINNGVVCRDGLVMHEDALLDFADIDPDSSSKAV